MTGPPDLLGFSYFFTDAYTDTQFGEHFRVPKVTARALRDALRFPELEVNAAGAIEVLDLYGTRTKHVATADMCILLLLYRLGQKGTWFMVEGFFNTDRTKLTKTFSFVRRYVYRRFGSLLKMEVLLPLVCDTSELLARCHTTVCVRSSLNERPHITQRHCANGRGSPTCSAGLMVASDSSAGRRVASLSSTIRMKWRTDGRYRCVSGLAPCCSRAVAGGGVCRRPCYFLGAGERWTLRFLHVRQLARS